MTNPDWAAIVGTTPAKAATVAAESAAPVSALDATRQSEIDGSTLETCKVCGCELYVNGRTAPYSTRDGGIVHADGSFHRIAEKG